MSFHESFPESFPGSSRYECNRENVLIIIACFDCRCYIINSDLFSCHSHFSSRDAVDLDPCYDDLRDPSVEATPYGQIDSWSMMSH